MIYLNSRDNIQLKAVRVSEYKAKKTKQKDFTPRELFTASGVVCLKPNSTLI